MITSFRSVSPLPAQFHRPDRFKSDRLLEEIHQSNEQILTGSDIDLVERLILNSQSLEKIEDLAIQIALKKTGGNASQAAKIVGLTRPQLLYRLNKKKTGSFPKFDSKG
jgi:DNA-binding NtrC family response regulator